MEVPVFLEVNHQKTSSRQYEPAIRVHNRNTDFFSLFVQEWFELLQISCDKQGHSNRVFN